MSSFFTKIADFTAKMFKATVDFAGSFIKKSIKTQQRTFFPFQETWQAGYRPAFLRGNRPIDPKHVDELMKLLTARERTKFTVSGTATPLLPLMEVMEEVPAEERLQFYNIYGEDLTLDSQGVRESLYYLVLDGQHRVAACLTYHFDMLFQLVQIEGNPLEFVSDYNYGAKPWKGSDWILAHRITGALTSPLFAKMDEVGEILPGVSERYKTAILAGNFDGIRKADAINGEDNIIYDEDIANRGIGFAKAIAVTIDVNEAEDTRYACRYLRSLDGMKAIMSVTRVLSGELLAHFDLDMKNWLGNLDTETFKMFGADVLGRNYGRDTQKLLKNYKEFATAHRNDRAELSAEIDSRYEALAEKRKALEAKERVAALDGNTGKKPKRLKTGSVEEMRLNAEAILSYTERKNAEKAEKNSH